MRYLAKNFGVLYIDFESLLITVNILNTEGKTVLTKEFDFSQITQITLDLKEDHKLWLFLKTQLNKVILQLTIHHYWIILRDFGRLERLGGLVGYFISCAIAILVIILAIIYCLCFRKIPYRQKNKHD